MNNSSDDKSCVSEAGFTMSKRERYKVLFKQSKAVVKVSYNVSDQLWS